MQNCTQQSNSKGKILILLVTFAKNAISNVLDCSLLGYDTASSDILEEQVPLTTRKTMV